MSDFSSLQLALTALTAQQRGLDVAAQNAANVNTEGYSRQRADMTSIGAPAVPAIYSTYTGSGGGVQVDNITRFRDSFLEIQAALSHGAMANLDQGASTMNSIQDLFNEPSDSGIASQLSSLWTSFATVANNPGDLPARTQLLEQAQTLATSFNSTSQQLTQLEQSVTAQLGGTVTQINSLSAQVAQLNQAIKANTISGLPVNDLLDKRDLLANQLAQASGATLRAVDFNQVDVTLNGTALVQNDQAQSVKLDTSGPQAVIRWVQDNSAAQVTSGTAGGQLNAVNNTIPGYLNLLNNVATTLRDEVNGAHAPITGSVDVANQNQSANPSLQFDVSLDGGPMTTVTIPGADWSGINGASSLQTAMQIAIDAATGPGKTVVSVFGGSGQPLTVSVTAAGAHTLQVSAEPGNNGFTTLLGTTPVGLDGVGGRQLFVGKDAATLAVSPDVANNPGGIAAGTAAGGPLDGSNALNISELSSSQTGADSVYRQMITQLGVDTATATSRDQTQQAQTQAVDSARSQNSGVNLDEEMTNLVAYQHAYEAAAKFMTAIDSMLNTLINNTGLTT
jgi:flagellar hook-associated protein 1 FlgK